MCLVFGVASCFDATRHDATRPNRDTSSTPNRQDTPRPTRPNRQDTTRSTRPTRPNRDTSSTPNRPNRRAEIDRIERTRPNRRAEIDRIDRTRPNRHDRIDAPKSTEIDRTDPIGRPPTPFSVGRAVLDPRSLNFFALHCAFLQKSCKKEGEPSTAQWRAKSHTFS